MRSLLVFLITVSLILLTGCGEGTENDPVPSDAGLPGDGSAGIVLRTAWIGSSDCVCSGFAPLPGGGWLAAGTCTEPRGYGYGILASIDEEGTVNEICRFEGRDIEVSGIIPVGDGSFVIYGSDSPTWDDLQMGEMEVLLEDESGELLEADISADYWVAKVNAGGEIIWTRSFSTPADEYCAAAMECPNGDLVLAGSSIPSDGPPMFRLVRAGADGGMIWDYTYGLAEGQLCEHAVLLSDGCFLLGGTVNSIDMASAMPVFLKVSRDGEEVFLAECGQEGSGRVRSFVETPQGDIAAAGTRLSMQDGTEAFLTLLSASGVEEWTMNYSASGFDDVITDGSGGYLAFGDGQLWSLGPEGDVIRTIPAEGLGDSRVFRMTRLDGHGVLLAGSGRPAGSESPRGFVSLVNIQ